MLGYSRFSLAGLDFAGLRKAGLRLAERSLARLTPAGLGFAKFSLEKSDCCRFN